MWYFVIIVSIVWIGFFIWARTDYKRRRRDFVKKKVKPPFRSEEDLEEYGKPLEDYEKPTVDFDDAE